MELKLVFHVLEAYRVNNALGNIQNILDTESLSVSKVDLVVVNEAVQKFTNMTDIREKIEKVISNKISIKICENSMKKFGVFEEELAEEVNSVPSGIVEVVKLQSQGYKYIRI